MAAAPDAILLLVDRSASMESRVAGTDEARREYALKLIASAAGEFENNSHLILIDSATRKPETVSVASLAELLGTPPPHAAARSDLLAPAWPHQSAGAYLYGVGG